jgi:secreted trypsin-like serine protease
MKGRFVKWRMLVASPLSAMLLLFGFGSSSYAITNGTYDGTAHPAVGAFFDSQGDFCSGALVRSDVYGTVLLTAAHCGGGSSGVSVQVTFDPTLSGSSQFYSGTFWTDPQWNPSNAFNFPDNHDVGVVVFGPAQKPKVKPMPLAPLGSVDSLPLNSQITAIGYGLASANDYSSFGIRRDGTMFLTQVQDPYITTSPGPSNTCGGDSGGPELATMSGTVYVIAVTNYGDFGCNFYGVDHAVDTSEVQSVVNAVYPNGPS